MKITAQILDVDYLQLNGRPVIRLFCKKEDGEPVCILTNGFLPYFYLHTNQDFRRVSEAIKSKFPAVRVEVVRKFLPIGYGERVEVLKITGTDPSRIPEIREFSSSFGTPYEADILFKYRFMVDKGLKGMGWVEAEGKYIPSKSVKCKLFEAETVKPVERSDYVPLKYLSFDIECIPEGDRLPEPETDPVVIISISFNPDYRGEENIVLITKPVSGPGIIGFSSEEEMLQKFLEIIQDYDPDIIIGYNIYNFDLPYIVKRLEVLNLPKNLGRDDKPVFLKKLQNGYQPTVTGRVVVDPYDILRRDPYIRFRKYDLSTVSREMLGIEKKEMGGISEMRKLWNGSTEDIKRFVEYARRDSELAIKLVLEKNLLDKFFELSRISGLLLQDSLGGQTQRHECRILQEFFKRDILMPCKPSEDEIKKHASERYVKGALVLEPDIGYHDDGCVLVLDFASLYPSIIITFNICPTTIITDKKYESLPHHTSPVGAKFVKPEVREGIFPFILKELIETRKKVKAEMKREQDPERKRQLNAKQLALKVMANSLYGYTGYPRARLFVLEIANSITAYGRENIIKTKKLIEENFGVKVVYGDTDSVFVKTKIKDLEEAQKLGERISEFITSRLPGTISLEFEKIFKTFLIISKKRYAGWKFERSGDGWKDGIEMKGIETVRRDWCPITTETLEKVLHIILKDRNISEAARYVKGVIQSLTSGNIPLEKLTIVKGITKTPEAYDGIQPHVELVKKLRERDPSKAPMVGDRIGYVIIKGNELISKRAEDPEFVREKGLEIDIDYYIENQILPPVERIFEACGMKRSEIIEGVRQKNLLSFSSQEKVLDGFEKVVCKKCGWSFRRPPLKGVCPDCDSELLFSKYGYIGRFIKAV